MAPIASPAVTGGRSRVLGGITVSDTPLITRALEYVRAHSEPYLFNHAVRSWLFAVRLGNDVLKPYPPTPGLGHLKPDSAGYLSLTRQGIEEDFVPDLPAAERALVYATQGPWNSTALAEQVMSPAWKSKPSWFIAVNDRMLPADYELAIAKRIKAKTTTLSSGHVPMLSRPGEVAAVIIDAANSVSAGNP
jgi:pimeloyl-ACP methyl ester carboxylesterase